MTKKKVLLGMSGGIDSSVAAFLLQEQGYEVIGAYMNYWHDTSHIPPEEMHKLPENKCCSTESLFAARQIGAQLGFPVYTLNYQQNFKDTVVQKFLDSHESGVTPNPCVSCNIDIKFGDFFEKMKELGCDYLSTGHYAQIIEDSSSHKLLLRAGVDTHKDQSYFLYHLKQDQLKHILFPLGGMVKDEVRELAKHYGLKEILNKKESQGVCFFPEESYVPFLERTLPHIFKSGGNTTYHGKVMGKHKGLPRYTIGQRRGVDIGGFPEPIYVIDFDYEKNELILGDNEELFKTQLQAKNFFFQNKEALENKKMFARIRHLGKLQECIIKNPDLEIIIVDFIEPIRAITPGQTIVIYDEENNVLGGGEIINS